MKHLAIFKGDGDGIEKILTGKKLIESRFSKIKIAPFGLISKGDLVYMKPSGKEIVGQFSVKKVIFFDTLEPEDLQDIRQKYESELNVDEGYWKGKENCRYGSLIFIGTSSRFITSPMQSHKKDLRGWVVLS